MLKLIACALAIAVLVPRPGYAEECRTSVDKAVADAIEFGGYLVDLIDIPGEGADQLLVVKVQGAIVASLVFKSCLTGPPIGLVAAKAKGVPS